MYDELMTINDDTSGVLLMLLGYLIEYDSWMIHCIGFSNVLD